VSERVRERERERARARARERESERERLNKLTKPAVSGKGRGVVDKLKCVREICKEEGTH
jgi:hypothetical protein